MICSALGHVKPAACTRMCVIEVSRTALKNMVRRNPRLKKKYFCLHSETAPRSSLSDLKIRAVKSGSSHQLGGSV